VSNRVSRRQAERWSAQDQSAYQQQAYAQPQYVEAAPPPPAPAGDDVIAKLQQLGELRDQGILNQAEFDAQKQRVLAGG
jgi:hypothetical protein